MKRCSVYRHFDSEGRTLYIGASVNPIARLAQHIDSRWFYDIAKIEIEWHPSVEAAHAAEYEAIQREKPLHNSLHNPDCVRLTKPKPPRPANLSEACAALRCWLASAGKTQMDIAQDLGVNQSTISKLMAGKILPSIKTAHDIQSYTGGAVSSSSWSVSTHRAAS